MYIPVHPVPVSPSQVTSTASAAASATHWAAAACRCASPMAGGWSKLLGILLLYTHYRPIAYVLSYTYVLYVFIKSMCMIMFTIYVNEYIMYRQPFLELKNSALGSAEQVSPESY